MKIETSDNPNHGVQYAAFVCHHLVHGENLGFWEPFDSNPTEVYPNGELNGWCDKCDTVLMAEGEWNDKSETFANIQVVSAKSFFEIKKLNKRNKYGNG
ncbi:MAG: hypothetical protein AAGJ18_17295 [Bacteroidota bacterium]